MDLGLKSLIQLIKQHATRIQNAKYAAINESSRHAAVQVIVVSVAAAVGLEIEALNHHK
jgi:hypothetical protein